MQFVFKRDEEGRERVYDDKGALVAEMSTKPPRYVPLNMSLERRRVIIDAIERADEAGFWARHSADAVFAGVDHMCVDAPIIYAANEVTVDVPVADTAVLSVTVGGDES